VVVLVLIVAVGLAVVPKASFVGAEARAGGAAGAERTPLKSSGWATLRGKVTYDGDPPPRVDFTDSMAGNKDKSHCLKDDIEDPTWLVGPDKGVANVVVWLRPPAGQFFPIPDEQKKRTDVVCMDQPYCAFKPHVVVLFPSYWDPKTKQQEPTGQVFKVLNSSPIAHNVVWSGNPLVNPGDNIMVAAKNGDKPSQRMLGVRTGRMGKEDLVNLHCNLHLWMAARAWAFEHPYAAVTKEDGTFEIKNIPAGAGLCVVAWHEGAMPNWLLPAGKGSREGEAAEALRDGEVRELNFTVKK
jgi:hypothetical protein